MRSSSRERDGRTSLHLRAEPTRYTVADPDLYCPATQVRVVRTGSWEAVAPPREGDLRISRATSGMIKSMDAKLSRPFESIESAHEFIVLLEESIEEAIQDVQGHLQEARTDDDPRRVEALNLAQYKMSQLSSHMHKSRRALNDLRTIRRLLFGERSSEGPANKSPSGGASESET